MFKNRYVTFGKGVTMRIRRWIHKDLMHQCDECGILTNKVVEVQISDYNFLICRRCLSDMKMFVDREIENFRKELDAEEQKGT